MRKLKAVPLTQADFSPFGDVVEATGDGEQISINEGHCTRFHDLANVTKDSRLSVNIFRVKARACPIRLNQMERHPKSSQMFMPLGGTPYLVVVAPKGAFDADQIRAFLAAPGQGVNYHAGTWHHYCLTLEGASDFLVLDYADLEGNCDVIDLPETLEIIPLR